MRCLVAIDLRDHTADVLAQATRWATRLSATLDVMYVDERDYGAHLIRDPQVRQIVEREWAEIKKADIDRLEELVALLPEDIRGEAKFVVGRATEEVPAASANYDALLIGTHQRTGVQHFFLGSVAERVVRNAQCPVVVLRFRRDEE